MKSAIGQDKGSKHRSLQKNDWIIEEKAGIKLIFSPLLKNHPRLVHAFTTRHGGQSKVPFDNFNLGVNHTTDDKTKADARNNKEKLCQSLGLPFEKLSTPQQLVHSDKVVILEKVGQPGEVDGVTTASTMSPVFMTYADCVPIIIYDPGKHVLTLVHAGWRGTASGIVGKAIDLMINEYASTTTELICAIGPAIGSCCYPIGLEAVEKLIGSVAKEEFNQWLGKVRDWQTLNNKQDLSCLYSDQTQQVTEIFWQIIEQKNLSGYFLRGDKQIHADLKAINAVQLLAKGIEQIDTTGLCTSCRPDLFYSYRRSFVGNEGPTGRQAAIAALA